MSTIDTLRSSCSREHLVTCATQLIVCVDMESVKLCAASWLKSTSLIAVFWRYPCTAVIPINTHARILNFPGVCFTTIDFTVWSMNLWAFTIEALWRCYSDEYKAAISRNAFVIVPILETKLTLHSVLCKHLHVVLLSFEVPPLYSDVEKCAAKLTWKTQTSFTAQRYEAVHLFLKLRPNFRILCLVNPHMPLTRLDILVMRANKYFESNLCHWQSQLHSLLQALVRHCWHAVKPNLAIYLSLFTNSCMTSNQSPSTMRA